MCLCVCVYVHVFMFIAFLSIYLAHKWETSCLGLFLSMATSDKPLPFLLHPVNAICLHVFTLTVMSSSVQCKVCCEHCVYTRIIARIFLDLCCRATSFLHFHIYQFGNQCTYETSYVYIFGHYTATPSLPHEGLFTITRVRVYMCLGWNLNVSILLLSEYMHDWKWLCLCEHSQNKLYVFTEATVKCNTHTHCNSVALATIWFSNVLLTCMYTSVDTLCTCIYL